MPLRVTARPRLGPLRINTSTRGVTSVTLKLGPVSWRLWSRTSRSGLSSVDLPGPLSWRGSTRRLNATERQALHGRRLRRRAVLVDLVAAGLAAAAILGAAGWILAALAVLLIVTAWRYVALQRGLRLRVAAVDLLAAGLVAGVVLGAPRWLLVALAVLVAAGVLSALRRRPTPADDEA